MADECGAMHMRCVKMLFVKNKRSLPSQVSMVGTYFSKLSDGRTLKKNIFKITKRMEEEMKEERVISGLESLKHLLVCCLTRCLCNPCLAHIYIRNCLCNEG